MDVRTFAVAFEWANVEVRAVTSMLRALGNLTSVEAAWLAGFIGTDAAGRAAPPS